MDMVDIYRAFHPTTRQYTFFTFSNMNHILGQKASLNKCKKIGIIPSIISDHNEIKLDLSNKRNHRKYSNTWRLINTLLENQCMTEEIRKKILKVSRIQ
jgi:hypothetical protein